MSTPAADVPASPPFKDSDAIYIVAKRLESLAARMQSFDYERVEADLEEVSEWLSWLANALSVRGSEQAGAGDE